VPALSSRSAAVVIARHHPGGPAAGRSRGVILHRVSVLPASDRMIRADSRATLVARIVGVAFVVAGSVKFAAYGWELDNFRRFGLPIASAWVVAAGIIEVVGGVLLVRRQAIVPAVALLVITMVIAIAVSGIAQGDVVPSLTVAPILLAGLLFLLARASARAP
jgi:uncharacterized membrane protein YphA (DoxX/SURF4 family)